MTSTHQTPFPFASPRCPPPHLRIGDAERDEVCEALGEHYAAGRLGIDELAERQQLALSATTAGQLATLLADLPAGNPMPHPPHPPTGASMCGAGLNQRVVCTGSAPLRMLVAAACVLFAVFTLLALGPDKPALAVTMVSTVLFSALVGASASRARRWGSAAAGLKTTQGWGDAVARPRAGSHGA